jgi:hypothetical protein
MSRKIGIVLISVGLLGGCEIVDRPYYKLSAPDGTVTRESAVFSTLQIPMAEEILLGVGVLCYAVAPPLDMSAGDPCNVLIYASGSGADDFRFANLQFTAEVVDPQGTQIVVRALSQNFGEPPPEYGSCAWPLKAQVYLSYEDEPQQFILHLPPFTINSSTYEPPSVTFTYQRNADVSSRFWGR